MTEHDVKYLEDLQEEFDFRYKTMQSIGKLSIRPWGRRWLTFRSCMWVYKTRVTAAADSEMSMENCRPTITFGKIMTGVKFKD